MCDKEVMLVVLTAQCDYCRIRKRSVPFFGILIEYTNRHPDATAEIEISLSSNFRLSDPKVMTVPFIQSGMSRHASVHLSNSGEIFECKMHMLMGNTSSSVSSHTRCHHYEARSCPAFDSFPEVDLKSMHDLPLEEGGQPTVVEHMNK